MEEIQTKTDESQVQLEFNFKTAAQLDHFKKLSQYSTQQLQRKEMAEQEETDVARADQHIDGQQEKQASEASELEKHEQKS